MEDRSQTPILVIDDEMDIRELIADVLEQAGYPCVAVADGKSARSEMENTAFSLLIIDLRLKGEDGLELARRIRANSTVPILMLTGKGTESDRIISLELAADDFLMKPFNIRELIARVNALLRRSSMLNQHHQSHVTEQYECLKFGDWVLNLTTRQLESSSGESVALTFGEFTLLEVLAKHPKRVMSREQLLTGLRGVESEVFDRTVDVLISRLRNKLEINPRSPRYIRTERGVGYSFSEPVSHLM
ncbi:DNA-binding response regulator [Vibrio albus]|uniref:DNA-binding response regulator n=1 Tax=Vibrio albus TaxID=2200953 RepID=A0A2U3B5X5_9VIBR|nr:response regulator [Vibrio albus]PWI32201.1 DNA-binding response regulator [Vibrio albus]